MSDIPFYQTRMGHRFYEHTAPQLVRQLTRLNDLLELLVREPERSVPDEEEEEQPQRESAG